MKKTVFGFVLILGIMASLSSCGTTYKMVVGENVPTNRSATVTFGNGKKVHFGNIKEVSFQVREHNNQSILDALYKGKEIGWSDKTILTVPAGNNKFLFNANFVFSVDYAFRSVEITQEITNLEIRYDLEPGKKYIIAGTTKRTKLNLLGIGNYDLYVGIYDDTGKTLLREWKVGEFLDPYMIGQ